MAHVTAWLEGTAIATWTRESPSIWAYPTILTLHTAGLAIVVGASTVIDLRLLGFGRRIDTSALAPLFTMIAWAFALNAATGVLLFMADATMKSRQVVFYAKLMLIGLALWDTLVLRRRLSRHRSSWGPVPPSADPVPRPSDPLPGAWDPVRPSSDPAPRPWDPALAGLRDTLSPDPATIRLKSDPTESTLRPLAIASLVLWTGAIAAGRLMAYL
jgi:hypothetical protein